MEGPVPQKWAAPIIDFAIKSKLYIEKSISGTGLHIIGKCVEFDKSIHNKHIYTKADTANNIKSEQIELYLSTDTDKCKRGVLITGNLYEKCNYDPNSPLPTVSKEEFIKLFEAVKATKLVQAITRIDFKIVSHKFKEEDVSNIIQSQKAPTNIDVVDILMRLPQTDFY